MEKCIWGTASNLISQVKIKTMNLELFKTLENKNVLVTGGAGFIGSNLCENLLKINAKVNCLDNFATGTPP